MLAEIKSDLDTIHHTFLRFSLNIKRIQEKRLYLCGKYTTFAEFFQKEIGFGRHQAYHYIHAADILTNLLALGFPESELPTRERITRALDKLAPDHLGKVWKQVLKYKDEGQDIDSNSVEKAANELGVGGGEDKEDAETQEAEQRQEDSEKLIKTWKNAAKTLHVGLDRSMLTKPVLFEMIAVQTDINETSRALLMTLLHERDAQAAAIEVVAEKVDETQTEQPEA